MKIFTQNFELVIHGYSGVAANKDYVATAFKLMDNMWQTIRAKNIPNRGLNVIVYESSDRVFAGVELEGGLDDDTGLERKVISLDRYAYHKHVGPYGLIRQVGQDMIKELKQQGLETCLPSIEIYGHWNADASKLETELLMCLK